MPMASRPATRRGSGIAGYVRASEAEITDEPVPPSRLMWRRSLQKVLNACKQDQRHTGGQHCAGGLGYGRILLQPFSHYPFSYVIRRYQVQFLISENDKLNSVRLEKFLLLHIPDQIVHP